MKFLLAMLKKIDVDMPKFSSIKRVNEKIHGMLSKPKEKIGSLGNVYFYNDPSEIVAREVANPAVSPFLNHGIDEYFEVHQRAGSMDTETRFSGAMRHFRQGLKWQNSDSFRTPMINFDGIRYGFIFVLITLATLFVILSC
jgi:hypothetical protein